MATDNKAMGYKADTNYVLVFSSAEALDNGLEEFETYSEAHARYQQLLVSGYSVKIHDLGNTPCFGA